MTNRMVYVWLNILPLFLIVPVIVVFTFIAFCSKCLSEEKEKVVKIILTKFAKGVFGGKTGVLSEMPLEVEEDESGAPITYIRDKKLSPFLIKYVGLLALGLCLYIGMASWDVFLLKESSICDPVVDCYVNGGGNDPIDNCTEILMEGDNITVICYKYAFDIGMAIGVSGGIITALGLIFSASAAFWLFWYDLIKEEGRACIICVLLQYIIALSVPAFAIVTLVIPHRYLESLQLQPHVTIQIVCLSLTLFMGLAFPWWKFSEATQGNNRVEPFVF